MKFKKKGKFMKKRKFICFDCGRSFAMGLAHKFVKPDGFLLLCHDCFSKRKG